MQPEAGVHAASARWTERGVSLATAELSVLRELLWQAAGQVRQAAAMRRTLDAVEALAAAGWQARLARQLLLAALRRPLSLGAHHRCDTVVPA